MRMTMPHAAGADVALVANPVRLSATPTSYRHAPPLLGADTEAVLQQRLGLTTAEIAALRQAGLV
jgi:crotonobetainyl-CoA:carnitine CoA-transferase CaiB-like acyl-CoA transferase